MIIEYGDLADLLQRAVVGLLIAGLRPQTTREADEYRNG